MACLGLTGGIRLNAPTLEPGWLMNSPSPQFRCFIRWKSLTCNFLPIGLVQCQF